MQNRKLYYSHHYVRPRVAAVNDAEAQANAILFLAALCFNGWARRNTPPTEPWQSVSQNLLDDSAKRFLESAGRDLIQEML